MKPGGRGRVVTQRVLTTRKPAPTRLAGAIFERRQAQGLSLRQAAVAAGVNHSTLFRAETKADAWPDAPTLLRIARWLGCQTVQELAGLLEPTRGR